MNKYYIYLILALIIPAASLQADVLRQISFSGATEGEGGFDTKILSQGSDWNLGVSDAGAEDGLVATARDEATSGDSRLILIDGPEIPEFGEDPAGKGWVFSVRFKVNEGLSTSDSQGRPYAAFGVREENSNGKGCWPGLYNHDGQTSIRFTGNGGETWTATPGGDIPDIAGDGKFHTFKLWKYNKDGVTVVAVWMDDELVVEVNYLDLPDDDDRFGDIQGFASGTPVELCDVAVDTIQFTLYDNLEQSKPSRAFASVPSPPHRGNDVLRDTILSWKPGAFAARHDVYLGTVWDDVNDASTAETLDVLVSEGQDANTYDAGVLDFGQTYYWRVDEVNGAPDYTVFKGDVWSFTVEPFAYSMEDIVATSNTIPSEGQGPENTVNGSGLDEGDQHSTDVEDMWVGTPVASETPYIQFEFDDVYKLHEMLVWNYNIQFETLLGLGVKDATVEYSENGTDWSVLGDVVLNQAPGAATYTPNTTVPLEGVAAQFVRLTIHSSYISTSMHALSEVRFMYIPIKAREPQPTDGVMDMAVETTLSWRAGREAVTHEVYLGADPNALDLEATTTEPSYAVALNLGTTYAWQIVEVNEAEAVTAWAGPVWSFSTQDYIEIDGFETYDDDMEGGTTIFQTWIDGLDDPANGGSVVGNAVSPFAEQTIVRTGNQSMNLSYDNDNASAISEADRTFTMAQDWTAYGIQSLSLWFYGAADNMGSLYVKVNGVKVAYDGDPTDIAKMQWLPWNIDLSTVGADMGNVTVLTIGIEGPGDGVVYIDDICLYAAPPATTAGGLLHNWTFDSDLSDAVGGKDAAAFGDADFQTTTSKIGAGAAAFDGSGDYMLAGAAGDFAIGMNAMSVSFWLNVADADKETSDRILSNGAGSNTEMGWTFFMRDNAAGTIGDGVDAGMSDGGGRRIQGTNGNDTIDALDGDWHLLVGVFEYNGGNGTVDIYLDSVLETTIALADLGTWNGSPIDNTHALTFGAISGNPSSFSLNGMLDDVAIWDKALSQDEIDALWNGGAGQAAALIADD